MLYLGAKKSLLSMAFEPGQVVLPNQNLIFTAQYPTYTRILESGLVMQCGPGISDGWWHAECPTTVNAQSSVYFEVLVEALDYSDPRELAIGVAITDIPYGGDAGSEGRYQYFASGQKRFNGGYTPYGAGFAAGDVIGCSMMDNAGFVQLRFYVNGVPQPVWDTNILSTRILEPHFSVYQLSTAYVKRLRLPTELQYLPAGFTVWVIK